MRCVLLAESAILVHFHPLRMKLLLLCQEIVTLLALCTCKNDFGALCSHGYSPPKSFIDIVSVHGIKIRARKKGLRPFMPCKHSILMAVSQSFSLKVCKHYTDLPNYMINCCIISVCIHSYIDIGIVFERGFVIWRCFRL